MSDEANYRNYRRIYLGRFPNGTWRKGGALLLVDQQARSRLSPLPVVFEPQPGQTVIGLVSPAKRLQ